MSAEMETMNAFSKGVRASRPAIAVCTLALRRSYAEGVIRSSVRLDEDELLEAGLDYTGRAFAFRAGEAVRAADVLRRGTAFFTFGGAAAAFVFAAGAGAASRRISRIGGSGASPAGLSNPQPGLSHASAAPPFRSR